MGAGKKRNWAVPIDSGSWEDDYAITTGASDLKTIVGFRGQDDDEGPAEFCIAVYDGSGGITESNYQSLPIGSLIIDVQAAKIHMVQNATTIVSTGALT